MGDTSAGDVPVDAGGARLSASFSARRLQQYLDGRRPAPCLPDSLSATASGSKYLPPHSQLLPHTLSQHTTPMSTPYGQASPGPLTPRTPFERAPYSYDPLGRFLTPSASRVYVDRAGLVGIGELASRLATSKPIETDVHDMPPLPSRGWSGAPPVPPRQSSDTPAQAWGQPATPLRKAPRSQTSHEERHPRPLISAALSRRHHRDGSDGRQVATHPVAKRGSIGSAIRYDVAPVKGPSPSLPSEPSGLQGLPTFREHYPNPNDSIGSSSLGLDLDMDVVANFQASFATFLQDHSEREKERVRPRHSNILPPPFPGGSSALPSPASTTFLPTRTTSRPAQPHDGTASWEASAYPSPALVRTGLTPRRTNMPALSPIPRGAGTPPRRRKTPETLSRNSSIDAPRRSNSTRNRARRDSMANTDDSVSSAYASGLKHTPNPSLAQILREDPQAHSRTGSGNFPSTPPAPMVVLGTPKKGRRISGLATLSDPATAEALRKLDGISPAKRKEEPRPNTEGDDRRRFSAHMKDAIPPVPPLPKDLVEKSSQEGRDPPPSAWRGPLPEEDKASPAPWRRDPAPGRTSGDSLVPGVSPGMSPHTTRSQFLTPPQGGEPLPASPLQGRGSTRRASSAAYFVSASPSEKKARVRPPPPLPVHEDREKCVGIEKPEGAELDKSRTSSRSSLGYKFSLSTISQALRPAAGGAQKEKKPERLDNSWRASVGSGKETPKGRRRSVVALKFSRGKGSSGENPTQWGDDPASSSGLETLGQNNESFLGTAFPNGSFASSSSIALGTTPTEERVSTLKACRTPTFFRRHKVEDEDESAHGGLGKKKNPPSSSTRWSSLPFNVPLTSKEVPPVPPPVPIGDLAPQPPQRGASLSQKPSHSKSPQRQTPLDVPGKSKDEGEFLPLKPSDCTSPECEVAARNPNGALPHNEGFSDSPMPLSIPQVPPRLQHTAALIPSPSVPSGAATGLYTPPVVSPPIVSILNACAVAKTSEESDAVMQRVRDLFYNSSVHLTTQEHDILHGLLIRAAEMDVLQTDPLLDKLEKAVRPDRSPQDMSKRSSLPPVPVMGWEEPSRPTSAEIEHDHDEDRLLGDEEMKTYVERYQARKLSQGVKQSDLDRQFEFPLPEPASKDYSVRQAEVMFGNVLCEYEVEELNRTMKGKKIYYAGTARKHVAYLSRPDFNYGYDDERGDYKVVLRDHLAYRYEVVQCLGRGSFGQVLKCKDHKTGKWVAIKLIRNKQRFHHQALVETKILQQLVEWDPDDVHNVVHMVDSFYFRNHLCIAMELMSMNLYELIKCNSFKGCSVRLIRRFTVQALQAMLLLVEHGVVHCDLKPENILLVNPRKSQLKVIDFGSSCLKDEKVYTYIQSRFYRSPEVIFGMNYGLEIDMWSLGCILAEMFTGYPLFPGESEQEQVACIMEIFGLPSKRVLEQATRANLFFDSQGRPRHLVNSKGKARKPGSKTLQQALPKCTDELFLDFIAQCLAWDKTQRLTPEQAMRHPWIQHVYPRPVAKRVSSRRKTITTTPNPKALSSSNVLGNQVSQGQGGWDAPYQIPVAPVVQGARLLARKGTPPLLSEEHEVMDLLQSLPPPHETVPPPSF